MPSSNHLDNRDIQKDARAWSNFTGTNYTAALRQMQNPLAQGLLGDRLSARQLIATLTDHAVVGSQGGDAGLGENGFNYEPVWTFARDSDFIELALIADFLRLFSPQDAASEPGVGSYTLKHTAELFLAPHCSYVSNGRLIWVAATLGLFLSGEAYKNPNLVVEIDDRQHDYVRRTVDKGQTDPQGHHYRPAGLAHLRDALTQASTGTLLVVRWSETVPEVEPAPFHDWLLLQLGRQDSVGRVAFDYAAGVKDSDHRLARQPEDLLDILDTLGAASEFYEGGKRAVREWNAGAIRTDRIVGSSDDVEGHGAGAGTIERYDFSCPCGEGTVTEEHDNIPGFREHDVRLLCDRCRESWQFVEGRSVRDWALWPASLSQSAMQQN
ncbi:hypothetical protein [Frigoribacterium salinisoli]